jgi:Dolichyl-phosphate-mannose-protein mannosyltransferase
MSLAAPPREVATPGRPEVGLVQRTAALRCGLDRSLPFVMVAVSGLLLVWSRVLPASLSLWSDEAYTALYYVRPGPSAVFGQYIPNDHMLFELLAWATTNLTGDFSEAALRFWSVAPGIAAGVIMTWWLWRRLDRWVAAIFAVLAAAAPLYMSLTIQARGYGLAFLAAAVMVITADSLLWKRRRRDLVLFAVSATAGIWTLPVFVLAFLPLVGILISRPRTRRQATIALLVVGTASFVFYIPVLGGLISSSGQHYGVQLPWFGVISGPLNDLINPSVALLVPGLSLTLTQLIGGVVIAAGVVVLWRVPDRFLALILITPALFSYLFLELGRFYEADRFVSFVELPLLVLVAVALARGGQLLARRRGGRLVADGIAIALMVYALGNAQASFTSAAQIPIENFREVGQLTDASGITTIVSNSTKAVGFFYYLNRQRVHLMPPAQLEPLFCSNVAPFVYLEHGRSPLAATGCLRARGAVPISVPQTRSYINVWVVTTAAPVQPGSRVTVATPILTPRPLASQVTCPSIVEQISAPTTAVPVPVGQPFDADVTAPITNQKVPVKLTVIGSRLAATVPGAFTASHTTFAASGPFLVVRYRITNLGATPIKPEDTVNTLFGVSGLTRGVVVSAANFDADCTIVSPSVASALGQPSPYTRVRHGQTITTLAVYPLPAGGTPTRALSHGQLSWSAPALGLSAVLPPVSSPSSAGAAGSKAPATGPGTVSSPRHAGTSRT